MPSYKGCIWYLMGWNSGQRHRQTFPPQMLNCPERRKRGGGVGMSIFYILEKNRVKIFKYLFENRTRTWYFSKLAQRNPEIAAKRKSPEHRLQCTLPIHVLYIHLHPWLQACCPGYSDSRKIMAVPGKLCFARSIMWSNENWMLDFKLVWVLIHVTCIPRLMKIKPIHKEPCCPQRSWMSWKSKSKKWNKIVKKFVYPYFVKNETL